MPGHPGSAAAAAAVPERVDPDTSVLEPRPGDATVAGVPGTAEAASPATPVVIVPLDAGEGVETEEPALARSAGSPDPDEHAGNATTISATNADDVRDHREVPDFMQRVFRTIRAMEAVSGRDHRPSPLIERVPPPQVERTVRWRSTLVPVDDGMCSRVRSAAGCESAVALQAVHNDARHARTRLVCRISGSPAAAPGGEVPHAVQSQHEVRRTL